MLFLLIFSLMLFITEGTLQDYYIVNSSNLIQNNSCIYENTTYHPCATLDLINDLTLETNQRIYVYFMNSHYTVEDDLHFSFTNVELARMQPWETGNRATFTCTGDFTYSFNNVSFVLVERLSFYQCGRSNPVIAISIGQSLAVNISDTNFVQSRKNSLRIVAKFIRLIITDSTFEQSIENHGIFMNSSYMNITIERTNFTNSYAGSIFLSSTFSNSSLFLSQCYYFNNTLDREERGSAIYADNAIDVVVDSCNFENNNLTLISICPNVYGLLAHLTNFFMLNNSEFIGNNGPSGVVVTLTYFSYVIEIHNSRFLGNQATLGNGGIMVVQDRLIKGNVVSNKSSNFLKLIILNCIFLNNSALLGRGGILFASWYNALILVRSCSFIENRASNGGVLAIWRSRVVFLMSSNFAANNAIQEGGVLMIVNISSVAAINCQFLSNSANISGVSSLHNVREANIIECMLKNNSAKLNFGALLIQSANVSLRTTFNALSCDFLYNKAINIGGAIAILHIYKAHIENSSFIYNCANLGGAIYSYSIRTSSIIPILTLYRNTFFNNTASRDGGAIMSYGYNLLAYLSTFKWNRSIKRGGAMMIFLRRSTSFIEWRNVINIAANVSNSDFIENFALEGGALYICNRISEVNIYDLIFSKNEAEINGGALVYESSYSNDQLHIVRCQLNNNLVKTKAGKGGALFILGTWYNEVFFIQSTIFLLNKAGCGGAIMFDSEYSEITIENSTFSNNTAYMKGGALYFIARGLNMADLTFQYNVASHQGGAIYINSNVLNFLKNSLFIKNRVNSESGKGGGIYIEEDVTDCKGSSCVFRWSKGTKLTFLDNEANRGRVIYGGMIGRCAYPKNPTQHILPLLDLISINDTEYNNKTSAISSGSVNFCFCEEGIPICNRRKLQQKLYAGQTLTLNVVCMDQMNNSLPCIVKSEYNTTEFQLGVGQSFARISTFCEELNFTAYANDGKSSELKITAKILCYKEEWNTLTVQVTIVQCPHGFENDHQQCVCDNRLLRSFKNVECDIQTTTLITLQEPGWFSYFNEFLRVHKYCPLNYCSLKLNGTLPSNPDALCDSNRGGILCGQCSTNYSVILGSWKCMECSHSPRRFNFIWLTVVIALAGVVLVMFLLLVKMTVSSGTINGLIFYANILSFSGLLDYQSCSLHPILRIFLSWINLDFGIETCYYSGMDAYQKMWLQFVFPFYIWLLVGVIIFFCHYSSSIMKFMGMRNIEVLATLFLLSYAKLLKTVVTALSYTDVQVASADNVSDVLVSQRVWVYDASINYLSHKHLPLFVVSLLFLLTLFLPYTMFLSFGSCLQSLPKRRGLKWIHSTVIITVMDAYHAPYSRHQRHWTGFMLIIRCCLFTIFSTSYSISKNLFWIMMGTMFMFANRLFLNSSVYKQKLANILEVLHLLNLGAISAALLYGNFCSALTLSVIFSLILFLVTLLYHILCQIYENKPLYHKICKTLSFMSFSSIATKRPKVKVSLEDISEEKPTSSYIELREELIEN